MLAIKPPLSPSLKYQDKYYSIQMGDIWTYLLFGKEFYAFLHISPMSPCPSKLTPGRYTSLGRYTSPGRYRPRQVHPGQEHPFPAGTPPTVTAADGTHRTGILSCWLFIFFFVLVVAKLVLFLFSTAIAMPFVYLFTRKRVRISRPWGLSTMW